jgi:hypothetical protein
MDVNPININKASHVHCKAGVHQPLIEPRKYVTDPSVANLA